MRILLDENLDWRLGRSLPSHEVKSVQAQGWTGVKNGTLLRRAVEARFDAFITMDSSLVHQQNLTVHPIAVIVLRAPSNQIEDTQPLMPAVLQALATAPKGKQTLIES
jgi:predicted nuclease of predicted toxin-antitoxin system